jgi:hypothetical protein
MPFDLHWQDEAQTILRVDTHGEVTWGAWHALVDQLTAELAKAPHRIDLIFNDGSRMPPGNPICAVSQFEIGGHGQQSFHLQFRQGIAEYCAARIGDQMVCDLGICHDAG